MVCIVEPRPDGPGWTGLYGIVLVMTGAMLVVQLTVVEPNLLSGQVEWDRSDQDPVAGVCVRPSTTDIGGYPQSGLAEGG